MSSCKLVFDPGVEGRHALEGIVYDDHRRQHENDSPGCLFDYDGARQADGEQRHLLNSRLFGSLHPDADRILVQLEPGGQRYGSAVYHVHGYCRRYSAQNAVSGA